MLNYNTDNLRIELAKMNWLLVLDESDPNTQWELMFKYFLKAANDLCPMKDFRVTNKRPAFLTDELFELINERDTVLRLAKKHNNSNYWLRGTNLIKEVVTAVTQSKKEFVINQLNEHRTDSSKFWKTVRIVLPDKKSAANINVVWNPVKNELINGLPAANLINKYFCHIGKNLASEIEHTDMVFNPAQSEHSFVWGRDISIRDVLECINDLSIHKSSGIPELSSRILIDCLRIKVKVLTCIFNNCLRTGIFPDLWKVSTMVPIPKKVNAKHLKDFRPISLIPLPGKILERLIHMRMYPYFENFDLLCKEQGGFRRNKDTSQTVFNLVDYVYQGFNNDAVLLLLQTLQKHLIASIGAFY